MTKNMMGTERTTVDMVCTDTSTRKKNTRAADLLFRRAMEYFGSERVEKAMRYTQIEYAYMQYLYSSYTNSEDFNADAIIVYTFAAIAHLDALLKKGIKTNIEKGSKNMEEIALIEDSGLANYQDNSINYDDPQMVRVNYLTTDEKIRIPEKQGQDALSQLLQYVVEYWNCGTIKEVDAYHGNRPISYNSPAQAFLNWAKKQYNSVHVNVVGMEDPDSDCVYDAPEDQYFQAQTAREEWDERRSTAHHTIRTLCSIYHIPENAVVDCIQPDGNIDVRKVRALRASLEKKRECIHLKETFPEKEYKPLVRLYSRAFGLGMEYSLEQAKLSPQFYTDTAKATLQELSKQKKARKACRDKELAELEAGALSYASLSAEARRELSRRRRRREKTLS